MKQKYLYIYLVALAAVFSCVQIDESSIEGQNKPEFVPQSFTATIKLPDQTKATLDGSLEDGIIPTVWQPSDKIKVFCNTMGWSNASFINVSTETSETALFEGMLPFSSSYIGLYPYNDNSMIEHSDWYGGYKLSFVIPEVQTYYSNTFDPSAAIMVAKSNDGVLEFKHLCGFLAVQMKGQEKVKTITFVPRDANGGSVNIAGEYCIGLENINEGLQISVDGSVNAGEGKKSITLTCSEPVALSKDVATPFYFVLPPADYSAFTLLIETEDGKIMVKEGKNPLTVTRSHVKPTSSLGYAETVYVDLSEIGHSNCYIVPQAGLYSFDADVAGNGEYGYIDVVNFYPASPSLKPASVEVLWQDRDNVVAGVTLKDGKINFMSFGVEGNALIAIKDDNNIILWSWHIWVTDQPEEHVYVNDRGTFTMLDRNIGATRNDRGTGEEWRESQGMRYQWGRKDPFGRTVGSWNNLYNRINSQLSLTESIQYPNSFVQSSPWTTEMDYNLWSENQKTIYDPCPVGYRVPPMDVWRGFTVDGEDADRRSEMNVSGSFDHGWNFIYDGTNTAWYPTSYYISTWGDFHESEYEGNYWSVGKQDNYNKKFFRFYYDIYSDNPDFNCSIGFYHLREVSNAHAVRCMKDEGHVDISYPMVKMNVTTDISSTGATLNAEITNTGIAEITSRGFIWGTSADLTPENGTKVECGAGSGKFSKALEGLAHSTRYYVMAYATNERGTSYSNVTSFFTPYEGSAVNLSRNGTANCYIVPVAYSEYAFNASVKGNSDEPVGDIAEAVVLWESKNDRNPINEGDVIASVSLDGNMVHFFLPQDPVPGNSVIAVKDALGTILWSWHIWVVDFDPVATQQTYNSGAVMMDRNLGALNMIPGDYGALGLKYQWGRKDPFVGALYTSSDLVFTAPSDAIRYEYYNSSVDTMENAVKNPTVVYNDARWGDVTDLWDYKKTKYDPCPVGWRVSDLAAWEGLGTWSGCEYYVTAYTPTSTVYFPTAGYSDGSEFINNVSVTACFWFTEHCRAIWKWWDQDPYFNSVEVDYLQSVRCMKDDPQKPGNGDDYIVDDEYEW